MLLAAFLLVLGADKALLESLQSDDSMTRTRAAYALARAHDPADGTATARLERLLVDGDSAQRAEVVRGLLCREWRVPTDVLSRVTKLLADRDPRVREAVIDGMRCLPKKEAAALLLAEEPLAEKRPEGTASQLRLRILRMGMELDLADLRDPLRREVHKRSEFLFFKKDCTPESCADDLAALAWLGEDVSWMRERFRTQGREPSFFESLILLRLDALGGDAAAAHTIATEARASIDAEVRRKAVDWLIGLPPSPRDDVTRLLVPFVEDPDARIRQRAAATLASVPSRHAGASKEGLLDALDDPDPGVRLEAVAGLRDLGVRLPEREEKDPVVRALRNGP